MKTIPLLSLGIAALSTANIVFNHVPIHCDPKSTKPYHGCLKAQVCTSVDCDYLCKAPSAQVAPDMSSIPLTVPKTRSGIYLESNAGGIRAVAPVSTDGTCGSQNGGTICDPNSTLYKGVCCSQYGWCGNTDGHCLTANGCQSGCRTAGKSSVPSSTDPRSDGQCGKNFGEAVCDPTGPYGGCCSQYGYCGNTEGHCLVVNGCQNGCQSVSTSSLVSPVTSRAPMPTGEPVIGPVTITAPAEDASTAASTIDGTCGSSNGGTVCGNWDKGSCCSMYGFCGSTSAHCGDGCQSGPCLSEPAVQPPGPKAASATSNPGAFTIVGQAGVPAMHAALMPNGRVFFLDKVENYTQLRLPSGQYAYSAEYNPVDNTVVPLAYKTNAFCSGGAFLPDGRVISVGGNGPLVDIDATVEDGFDAIRYLGRSSNDDSLNGNDWSEPGNKLASKRWYATVQTMPDGTMFVASGSLNGLDPTVLANNNPTYEILNSDAISQGNSIGLDILMKNQPYYMYPFVHLLSDGSLFIFASKSADQFSVASNTIIQKYPDLPGDYRTYPNTGGSVMLAANSDNSWSPDIIICGGGAYQDITSPTDPSCGRIKPLGTNPEWEMDAMPEGRGMVEGTMLPDGTVIWLNGGSMGAQGFGLCMNPALEALLYDPAKTLGARWSTLASSTIPRLYHSVAMVLPDATMLIAGSNPVEMPILTPDANNPYITEFRVENYVPPYLQGNNANKRPTNLILSSKNLTPGENFNIIFSAADRAETVSVSLYHGGFVTHSLHMGARMMQLDTTGWTTGGGQKTLTVTMPPNHNVCPPGPYMVFVLCDGVPSVGQFVSVT